ncbi:MAG: hypothetical protein QRY72_04260 [Candidatus Rhabdochlamydia sp.]
MSIHFASQSSTPQKDYFKDSSNRSMGYDKSTDHLECLLDFF